jgi:hypothetical protein
MDVNIKDESTQCGTSTKEMEARAKQNASTGNRTRGWPTLESMLRFTNGNGQFYH